MSKTRAIRVTSEDEKQIQRFLAANPIFDFSTLARTAILSFIQEPRLEIKAIRVNSAKRKHDSKGDVNV